MCIKQPTCWLFLYLPSKKFENPTFYVEKSNIFFILIIVIVRKGVNMNKINERIKKARTNLHLSQEYVANFIGVNRSAIVEIESGRRKVSAEELGKFSELFQISTDELLYGKTISMPIQMFARKFGSLDETDQHEILNLIEFKKMMKEKK